MLQEVDESTAMQDVKTIVKIEDLFYLCKDPLNFYVKTKVMSKKKLMYIRTYLNPLSCQHHRIIKHRIIKFIVCTKME